MRTIQGETADAIGGGWASSILLSTHAVARESAPMERLPFTVRLARSERELRKVAWLRHAAYTRHVPEFAEGLKDVEAFDLEPGNVVLLAESKLDGAPLGTMRIETNRYRPLALEKSVDLPEWLQGKSLAEATRLGVSFEAVGRVVKIILFKAFLLYCLDEGIDYMVICARARLDKLYEALLFKDVFPGCGFIPMRHIGDIPHRVMAFELATAESRWAAAAHPLYRYIGSTHHADILMAREHELFPAERLARLAAARAGASA